MLRVTNQSVQNTVDLVYKIYIYLDFGGQLLVMLPVKLRFTKKTRLRKVEKLKGGGGLGLLRILGQNPLITICVSQHPEVLGVDYLMAFQLYARYISKYFRKML